MGKTKKSEEFMYDIRTAEQANEYVNSISQIAIDMVNGELRNVKDKKIALYMANRIATLFFQSHFNACLNFAESEGIKAETAAFGGENQEAEEVATASSTPEVSEESTEEIFIPEINVEDIEDYTNAAPEASKEETFESEETPENVEAFREALQEEDEDESGL